MASIVKRNSSYCVVYTYVTDEGIRKQKWETYKTKEQAMKRKKEVDYKKEVGTFVVPVCATMNDLLDEYVSLYGKTKWALSTYQSNVSLIKNYISPVIGTMQLQAFNARVMEKYYQTLLSMPAVPRVNYGIREKADPNRTVSASTVRDIHKLLRNCFAQAVKWEMMEKNPCVNATVPRATAKKRDIWDSETLFRAIELCQDERLKLAMNLAFCCTLRMGEMLGLTWDCVDISDKSMKNGNASIRITKEMQRTSKSALDELDKKDVIFVFPGTYSMNSTVLVLKTPKTMSSVRRVYLPESVAQMLCEWKKKQDLQIEMLGSEYKNYNLVFASPVGLPMENSSINSAFRKLISENDLPPVVFHSLRHASITYKLKLSGGDIKAVQGDSGHSQAKMVTDQYSHILDEDRQANAKHFEEAFYSGKKDSEKENESFEEKKEPDMKELLQKILKDPEAAALLRAMARNLKE